MKFLIVLAFLSLMCMFGNSAPGAEYINGAVMMQYPDVELTTETVTTENLDPTSEGYGDSEGTSTETGEPESTTQGSETGTWN
ncbi:unnamed protein product [Ceutorhynchus assimilis]|uniref:Uncharacterized protein n=1 Tax=Ceutorhynchus assimilis TaxID=467358 RepID=A0A9N9MVM3_9CUCU|nr:unnamed protein product [Ceutorhynchus assimilis]